MRKEPTVLDYITYLASDLLDGPVGYFLPVDRHHAFARLDQPQNDAQQSRLSAPTRPNQGSDHPRPNRQLRNVKRRYRSVPFADVLKGNHLARPSRKQAHYPRRTLMRQ